MYLFPGKNCTKSGSSNWITDISKKAKSGSFPFNLLGGLLNILKIGLNSILSALEAFLSLIPGLNVLLVPLVETLKSVVSVL